MLRPRADRGQKRGDTLRFIRFHHLRVMAHEPTRTNYATVTIWRGVVKVHRWRAEQALGKPLPPGAIVHHADGTLRSDAPLVICQDAAYHKQLHARMRIQDAGGDPWTEKICGRCRVVKPRAVFGPRRQSGDGLQRVCVACGPAHSRAKYVATRLVERPRVW